MSTASSNSDGITNLVLLQHMQGMRSSLEQRMDGMEKHMKHLQNRMDGMQHTMKEGFVETHRRFNSIDAALQRLYVHRISILGRIEKLEEVVGIAQ